MKVKRKVAIILTETDIKEMIINQLDMNDIFDIKFKLVISNPRSAEQGFSIVAEYWDEEI